MDSRLKNSGRKGIRRHEYEGLQGWFVRYMREGALFRKVFSDRDFGGEEGSFAAAEEYHRQLVSYFPPRTRKEHSEQRRKNSREIVGISRVTKITKKKEYHFWQASWTDVSLGKARNKVFSINKYGEEEAKRLAIETRQKHLDEFGDQILYDYGDDLVWLVPPEKISIAANIDTEGESEGAIALREHRLRERSRELRKAKILDFIEKHGRLYCEICDFDFEATYGELGAGLIEVHHTKAIADYTKNDVTTLSDLMLVCSNCHYVIHRDEHYERNFTQIMRVVSLTRTQSKTKERRANKSVQTRTTSGPV
ncbi:AP2 domain-containing protein [Synoicihabitans lomoniglobus]|uniref:AP2 domain-containing protein n=1 Tax=Synoicihabitans lomoniglobus TaxID=2909285 RepID=A0AAF0CRZ4_9BACT|nr:HNH endonuclease [Opitutaceae bacterium LMO-M01]WED67007.1 AP2 domain-containing protein [Opitutaceae bacterium LMO-M01]